MRTRYISLMTLPLLASCAQEEVTNPPNSYDPTPTPLGKPNILVVVTDDQRWDTIGVVGNTVIQTPTINALANRGLYAPEATVTTPVSCASRATVLTGQFARNNGVYDFFTRIDLDTTYPALLQEEGYYTGFIGKWGTLEGDADYFEDAANLFDYWGGSMYQSNYWHERSCNYVVNNGTTDKHNFQCNCPDDGTGNSGEQIRTGSEGITDPVHQDTYVIPKKVVDFLDAREADGEASGEDGEVKPFCLSISYKGPHGPWQDYDTIYASEYEGIAMPLRDNVDYDNAMSQPDFLTISLNADAITKIETKDNIDGALQSSMRRYYRLINGVDDSMKQILEELESRGLADNTVIIFMGDNGQFLAEHGFSGKWLMYEESIRVPFFIYDPRSTSGGGVTNEFVQNIDIAPTVLDLAGVSIPSDMDGKSLLDLYDNPTMAFRSSCFGEHHYVNGTGASHIERSECYKNHGWKYIKYIDQTGDDAEELYNLEDDPYEMQNLALEPDYYDTLVEYRAKYNNYFLTTSPLAGQTNEGTATQSGEGFEQE